MHRTKSINAPTDGRHTALWVVLILYFETGNGKAASWLQSISYSIHLSISLRGEKMDRKQDCGS